MKKIIITIIAIIILVNICVYDVLSSLTYIKKYHYYYYCNYHRYYYFPLISVFSITFACDHVQDLYKATKKERKVSHKSNCNTCCVCYLLFSSGNEFLFAIITIN